MGVVQYFWLKQGWRNTFGLNKGVVQYFGLKQRYGAKPLDLNKGVMQYFWLKQGCCAILFD